MILAANIGLDAKAALKELAARRGISISDAARIAAVVGAGGTEKQAKGINDAFSRWRETLGLKARPGGRRSQGSEPSGTVSLRLPAAWARAIRERGGLKTSLLKGLDIL